MVPEKKAGEEKHSGVTVGEGRRAGGDRAAGARLDILTCFRKSQRRKKKWNHLCNVKLTIECKTVHFLLYAINHG